MAIGDGASGGHATSPWTYRGGRAALPVTCPGRRLAGAPQGPGDEQQLERQAHPRVDPTGLAVDVDVEHGDVHVAREDRHEVQREGDARPSVASDGGRSRAMPEGDLDQPGDQDDLGAQWDPRGQVLDERGGEEQVGGAGERQGDRHAQARCFARREPVDDSQRPLRTSRSRAPGRAGRSSRLRGDPVGPGILRPGAAVGGGARGHVAELERRACRQSRRGSECRGWMCASARPATPRPSPEFGASRWCGSARSRRSGQLRARPTRSPSRIVRSRGRPARCRRGTPGLLQLRVLTPEQRAGRSRCRVVDVRRTG